jgi:hypothetical protein
MRLPAANESVDTFMINETDNLTRSQSLIPRETQAATRRATRAGDQIRSNFLMNLSLFKSFYSPTGVDTKAFKVGVSGLCGCTALAIISRDGIYAAHYYETPFFFMDDSAIIETFMQMDEFNDIEFVFPEPGDTKEEIEEKLDALNLAKGELRLRLIRDYVLGGLRNGITTDDPFINGIEQESLTDHRASFQDSNYTRVYLLVNNDPDVQEDYQPVWDSIRDALFQIVPELAHPGVFSQIAYDTVDPYTREGNKIHDRTAIGKMLIKFDPRHRRDDGSKVKKVVLWMGRDTLHDDEWL